VKAGAHEGERYAVTEAGYHFLSVKGRFQGKLAPAHAGTLLEPKPEIME
jgi:hypothetical protein